MTVASITSRRHPLVSLCRQVAKGATDEPLVLLDGEHLANEAIAAGVRVETVITTTPDSAVARAAAAHGAVVYRGTDAVLAAASPARTTSGIVALARWQPGSLDAVMDAPVPRVVGLVDVQDPGNVGAIIRSADALGATGLIAMGRTADPGSWKALRGAMGSTFRLPIVRAALDDVLEAAVRRRFRIAATIARAGEPLGEASLAPPVLILLGNEGAGLTPNVIDHAHVRIHLPMRAGVESLNVAVTAALVLYEARRQSLSRSDPSARP